MITDPAFYVLAVAAVLLAGISKGGFGSGAGIFATPLVALTLPIPQAAAILLPIICLMDLTGLYLYRKSFSRELLRILMPGGLAGVILGALTFRYLNDAWIRTLLGATCVAFVAHRYLRRAQTQAAAVSVPKGVFWSATAGFASTIAHSGGPPLNIYLLPLKLDKSVMVGTTVIFLAITNFVKLVPYTLLGLFDRRNLLTSLVLLPLAPVGILLGVWLMRRLSETTFYRICYTLLLVVGAKLLYDGLRGIL